MTPAQIKAALQQARRYGSQLRALDRVEPDPYNPIWQAWRKFLGQFEYNTSAWHMVYASYWLGYEGF